jgi:hypothetical protein
MTNAELARMGERLADLRCMRGFKCDRSFEDVIQQGRAASQFAGACRDHPDMAGAIKAERAEKRRVLAWSDFYNERGKAYLKANPEVCPWIERNW